MKNFLLLASSLLALSACHHDSDPQPARAALLTAKPWRITAATTTTVSGGITKTTDDFANFTACQRDNFFKFNPDHTLIIDEGPSTCSTSAPQSTTLRWDLYNNETKVLLTAAGTPDPANATDVLELTASTFRFRLTNASSPDTVKTQELVLTAF